jgi:hypothetical protein
MRSWIGTMPPSVITVRSPPFACRNRRAVAVQRRGQHVHLERALDAVERPPGFTAPELPSPPLHAANTRKEDARERWGIRMSGAEQPSRRCRRASRPPGRPTRWTGPRMRCGGRRRAQSRVLRTSA